MSTKLRSGKVIDQSMDELSGLFSKSMKLITPKTRKTKVKTNTPPKDDGDMLSSMFGNFTLGKSTLGKSIGKSRRKKSRLTYKKTHGKRNKTPANTDMELTGGKRRGRRSVRRSVRRSIRRRRSVKR